VGKNNQTMGGQKMEDHEEVIQYYTATIISIQ